jgi:hypothetical protein
MINTIKLRTRCGCEKLINLEPLPMGSERMEPAMLVEVPMPYYKGVAAAGEDLGLERMAFGRRQFAFSRVERDCFIYEEVMQEDERKPDSFKLPAPKFLREDLLTRVYEDVHYGGTIIQWSTARHGIATMLQIRVERCFAKVAGWMEEMGIEKKHGEYNFGTRCFF